VVEQAGRQTQQYVEAGVGEQVVTWAPIGGRRRRVSLVRPASPGALLSARVQAV